MLARRAQGRRSRGRRLLRAARIVRRSAGCGAGAVGARHGGRRASAATPTPPRSTSAPRPPSPRSATATSRACASSGWRKCAVAAARPRDAVCLLAADAAMTAAIGAPRWPSIRPYIQQTLDQARTMLDDDGVRAGVDERRSRSRSSRRRRWRWPCPQPPRARSDAPPRGARRMPADRARARRRTPDRARADQQADRRRAGHRRRHRRPPRGQHPRQARLQLTRADRRLGGRARGGHRLDTGRAGDLTRGYLPRCAFSYMRHTRPP